MNNQDCTQTVIFEKLIQYSKKNDVGFESISDQKDFLGNMYRFLNATIDNRYQTSARIVTTSKKGLMGKLAVFCKKVFRKISFWYVEPICKSQTQFNEMCTQFCINTYYLLEQIQKEERNKKESESEVQKQIQTLQDRVHILCAENDELKKKLDDIKKEYVEVNIFKETLRCIQDTSGELAQVREHGVYIRNELQELTETIHTFKEEFPYLFEGGKNDFWNKQTVAQSGEDAILAYIMMVLDIDYKKEYYLDLGANHARELSNTYMLYKKGMRGVLVEANPRLISELKFLRSEDVILNKCIADKSGQKIKFYVMNGDGLSSSDLDSVNEALEKNPALAIDEIIETESITVNDVLNQYFDKGPLVLNVDVEGLEEEILRQIDYEKFAPKIIVVERIDYDTTLATEKRIDGIQGIMEEKGYFEYAFTGINSIYINYQWLKGLKK